MIERLYYQIGDSEDPYYNLALEQHLMETVPEDACILYLWQNRNTVVIGRNQNPWKECRLTELAKDGGQLARRLSGGGAVYHDLGNLNFTFLVSKKNYDLLKQLWVILEACRSLGIPAELTGRNDVAVEGRKISGNAFYDSKGKAYHHGTLLIDVDMEALGRYLMPSRAKLQSKGVDSVRSRVGNLRALCPDLTVEKMENRLVAAFSKVYGLPAEPWPRSAVDGDAVEALRQRNASREWNYGRQSQLAVSLEHRFPWGGVELRLEAEAGIVREAAVHTDAMDWTWAEALANCLEGVPLVPQALAEAAASALPESVREDLSRWLELQDL